MPRILPSTENSVKTCVSRRFTLQPRTGHSQSPKYLPGPGSTQENSTEQGHHQRSPSGSALTISSGNAPEGSASR